MTPQLTLLLVQINSIQDPQARRVLTELLQINDDLENKVSKLANKISELDNRTVGMVK